MNQFITRQIIPELRTRDKGFSFRFHDLRATYGVNLVRNEMAKVKQMESNVSNIRGPYYFDILSKVQERMGHSNRLTTERYLKWSEKDDFYMDIQNRYEHMLSEFGGDYGIS